MRVLVAAAVIAIAGIGFTASAPPGADTPDASFLAQLPGASGTTSAPAGVRAPSASSPSAAVAAARVSGAERCKSARRAVRWYRGVVAALAVKMGLTEPRAVFGDSQESRESRPCPRHLSKRLRTKAHAYRLRYERWYAERGKAIARLERGMRGTPMAGTGRILERHGRRYGVSPYFMVAVAATESSIGHAACSNNRFNVWGLASCNQSWYVPPFRSWDEAIAFYARFLARRWPGHSTPYSFRGYAACSDCWARKVSYWMGALFGVPARTVWP